MARHALALALVCASITTACREAGRPGRAGTRTPDSGLVLSPDAGFVDGGAADAGPIADAGVADAGHGPPDTGVADAGTPDSGAGPGVSVYDLQDPGRPGRPALDTRVRLRDVVVTAVGTRGDLEGSFWVQDPAGGPYSGILVFRPAEFPDPGAQVGDVVSVTGTFTEYFDVTEVVLETLDSLTPGTPLQPRTLSPLELANGSPSAESWEGVLVRVADVLVLDTMPDAPDDYGEYVVTGGLRIGDDIFALDPRPGQGTSFSGVVGVHHHSFENYKLLPRGELDFTR